MSVWKTLILLTTLATLSACKLTIVVPEGGSVQSQSGEINCPAASTCELDISTPDFDETLVAIPEPGMHFLGWKRKPGSLFGDTNRPARVVTKGFELFPGLMTVLASDSVFYLMPEFSRYPSREAKIQAYDALWQLIETEFWRLKDDGRWDLGYYAIELDLEKDGDKDLLLTMTDYGVVLNGDRFLFIARNNGVDGFSLEPLEIEAADRDHVVADFNGDGLEDVFKVDSGYDAPPFPFSYNYLLLQTPDGDLEDASHLIGSNQARFYHGVCAGDIDQDGDVDVNVAAGFQYIWVNSGDGVLTDETDARFPRAMLNYDYPGNDGIPTLQLMSWVWCHLADFNNDGFPDLILGDNTEQAATDAMLNPAGNSHLRLLNDGSGRFLWEPPASVIPNTGTTANNRVYTAVEMGSEDFNSDGCLDLVTVSTDYQTEQHTNVYLGDCKGGLSLSYNHVQTDTPLYTTYLDFGDFDSDGDTDFLTTITQLDTGGEFAWIPKVYFNLGDGTFNPQPVSLLDKYGYSPLLYLKLMWSRQASEIP